MCVWQQLMGIQTRELNHRVDLNPKAQTLTCLYSCPHLLAAALKASAGLAVWNHSVTLLYVGVVQSSTALICLHFKCSDHLFCINFLGFPCHKKRQAFKNCKENCPHFPHFPFSLSHKSQHDTSKRRCPCTQLNPTPTATTSTSASRNGVSGNAVMAARVSVGSNEAF